MKKILSLVLALVMLLCTAAAFAEAPDSPEKIETVTTDNENVSFVPVDEEEMNEAFKDNADKVNDAVADAASKGDVKSLVAEEAKDIIPDGFNTMLGTGTVYSVSEVPEDVKSLTVTISFPTTYQENEKVVLLVAILDADGNAVEFFAVEGKANADGDVVVTFDEATLNKIGGKKIKVFPFSEDGIVRN